MRHLLLFSVLIFISVASCTTTPPKVSTLPASNIGANNATLHATVTGVGSPVYTKRGFCYSSTPNPTTSATRIVVSGEGAGEFEADVSNLNINLSATLPNATSPQPCDKVAGLWVLAVLPLCRLRYIHQWAILLLYQLSNIV